MRLLARLLGDWRRVRPALGADQRSTWNMLCRVWDPETMPGLTDRLSRLTGRGWPELRMMAADEETILRRRDADISRPKGYTKGYRSAVERLRAEAEAAPRRWR